METTKGIWWQRIVKTGKLLFWLAIIALVVQQSCAPYWINSARNAVLTRFQEERKSRVIAMIHREETVSFFGVPLSSYISIEDSEAVLRAIRLTPPDQPIDFILHTPGGLVLAAGQIAKALAAHKAKVTVFVPHYAMSGGTLIALAADEVVMDPNAVLGPVDPQLGSSPAASIIKVIEQKPIERVSDQTVILADMARKAQAQVYAVVNELLQGSGQMPSDKAAQTAKALTEGRWTHDFPINVKLARELGLKVSTDMPRSVYELMELYPQAASRRPTVLYLDSPQGARDGAGDTAPPPSRPEPRK